MILLAPLFLGTFMALLNQAIVAVALPSMGSALHTDVTGLQWVVNSYTLCLAAFTLSGGALGDRFGRKRVFLIGAAVFTVSSVLCAMSPTIGVLIAARVLQGVGAAVLVPGTLSLIAVNFPDPARRAKIIGLWSVFGGSSVIVGPVLGGLLVQAYGWPSIFLVNIPVGLLVIALGLRGIPESADPAHAALDPFGQLLAMVGLGSLCYGLIENPVTLLLAVAALTGFVLVELRVRRAMLPLALLTSPRFARVSVASLALGFGGNGALFIIPLFLQQAQGRTALQIGLLFLPMTATTCLTAPLAGSLTRRYGIGPVMVAGYTLTGIGLAAMALFGPRTGVWPISLVFALTGLGLGLAIGPTMNAAVTQAPRERAGLASAVANTTRQLGTAIGVALLGLAYRWGFGTAALLAGAVTLAGAVLSGLGSFKQIPD